MSGRAIALLSTSAAGLFLIAASLLMPADKRFLAIASGFGTGAAGATAAVCWRKPQSQKMKEAIERVRDTLIDEAEKEIRQEIQPAPWVQQSVDIVSEPINELDGSFDEEESSLFAFEIKNPWEETETEISHM